MPKKRDPQLKVLPVPREGGPDLERIAKAIVALALSQLQQVEEQGTESSPPNGEAA